MAKGKEKIQKIENSLDNDVPLHLYNTLTRKKEIFRPIKKDEIGMYTCGPTVYWYQHIGNLKAYIFADLLKRVLIYNNYKVRHIINITDVGHLTSDADEGEDKMVKAGKRITMGEKRNPTDFALWKFSESPGLRQQEWKSPWRIGFPGWHIECSAMSMKYLGEHFDIHTGGEDHIPVHHTNEIAQSEAATGKKFVNYWMHEAFLLFKGEKISKSKGGLYTLPELEALGYNPLVYRYFNLLGSYRKPLNFTLENLQNAQNSYKRLRRKIIELRGAGHGGKDSSSEYKLKFLRAINNDLNTPKAIQVVWKLIEDISIDSKKKIELLEKFDEILGVGIKDMKEEKINVPE